MARCYNYIYTKLVDDETDVLGHIAYALYKADKISYIEDFQKKNGGKDLSEDDLKPFHDVSCLDANIQRYHLQAMQIMQEFSRNMLNATAEQIETDLKNNWDKRISEIIQPLKPPSMKKSYFHGAAQSVIGAFVFMIILAGLLFFVSLSTKQYKFTIGGNGNANIEQCSKLPTDTISSNK